MRFRYQCVDFIVSGDTTLSIPITSRIRQVVTYAESVTLSRRRYTKHVTIIQGFIIKTTIILSFIE